MFWAKKFYSYGVVGDVEVAPVDVTLFLDLLHVTNVQRIVHNILIGLFEKNYI